MTAIAGWIIICTGFFLAGTALMWPAYRVLRPRFASTRRARWAYAAAGAACGLALWFLIPLLVGILFGRAAH